MVQALQFDNFRSLDDSSLLLVDGGQGHGTPAWEARFGEKTNGGGLEVIEAVSYVGAAVAIAATGPGVALIGVASVCAQVIARYLK